MGVYIASFKITGVSGLLQNNPAGMKAQDTGGIKTKDKYTPEGDAAKAAYKDAEGRFYVNTEAFRKALISACSGRKIGKATANKIIQAAVFPVETRVVLLSPDTGKPLANYEIDTRRAVIQRQGISRSRPLFPKWQVVLDLEIDEDFIAAPDPILQLLNIAGKIVGVGDYRVEKKGTFGRFTAELVENKIKARKAG